MLKQIHWNKWGFIPSLLLLTASIAILLLMADSPRWPYLFSCSGTPGRYGNNMELWNLVIFPCFFILGLAYLDEGLLLARKWQYNIAGATAAFQTGTNFAALLLIHYIETNSPLTPYIIMTGPLIFGLFCAICAWLLESLRRYPQEIPPPVKISQLPDLTSKNWFYWEHCNPEWLNGMLIFMSLGVLAIGLTKPLLIIFNLLLVSIILLPFIGGFYFTLTPQQLSIKFGWLKIPVLKLHTANIKTVEAIEINPLRDFGGWGIRYSLGTGWGFILGSSCVRVAMLSGRKITISLSNPALVVDLFNRISSLRQ